MFNLGIQFSHFLVEFILVWLFLSLIFWNDCRNFCFSSNISTFMLCSGSIEILVIIGIFVNFLSLPIITSSVGLFLTAFFLFLTILLLCFLLVIWFSISIRSVWLSSSSALIGSSGTTASTTSSESSFFILLFFTRLLFNFLLGRCLALLSVYLLLTHI